MRLTRIACGVEAEPLKTPFGFKGNALTCLWQVAVTLEAGDLKAVGLGVQSVLWSDANVFARYGEQQGNGLMYRVTQYALRLLAQEEIDTPAAVQERIFDGVYRYAVEITGMPSLSKTFVRNALVSVDMALCQLWIRNRKTDFDALWPLPGQRQKLLANVPLITYGTPIEEAVRLANRNTPLLKIKIGSDPQKDGSISGMLRWDQERLLRIHEAVKDIPVPYTESGHVLYYLDANGRYDSMDTLRSLLDFADAHGVLERTVLLEEPFPENSFISVKGLPVCVAADESIHDMDQLRIRQELGYKALTLKPIAKGISVSLDMARYALENGMHCFCADLTVNPVMVTWNMCVAARLNRLPGMRVGIVESNGSQNYSRWETLKTYHPMAGSGFLEQTEGVCRLDGDFWQQSGGIFEIPPYYWDLGSREVLWNGE